mgnify:CR=1 FL=1
MKRILLSLLCLVAFRAMAQVSFGKAEKLNNDWHFLRIDSAWNIFEQRDMNSAAFDDSHWRSVTLPHDWGVELPMSPDKGSCQGYLPGGTAWYRHTLDSIPAGQQAWVYFEGVYNYSEVYLNGQLLGKRPSGFASFLYHLTPYLRYDGKNVLAVRVNHAEESDSRWYTGSGIYRNVWLITAPEIHLAQWGTAYRLIKADGKRAVLEVDVETTDERASKTAVTLTATVELKDETGHTVAHTQARIGSQEKKTVRLTVANARRWTLQQPYLYTLVTQLSNGDQSVVKAGLRTLDFSPTHGFALNGEWMKVKGVCLHDDAGVLGTAVPKDVWKRRLIELKAIGVNAIRMSHNPHAPELYDLCDELGLLVMDEASDEWEFPKRKWLKGWNMGRPGRQGTFSYFAEWIERDVADMVRRDRCHPSIFMWSIGNEVDYPNDPYSHPVLDGGNADFTQPAYGGYKPDQPHAERIGLIAQRLAPIIKRLDPSRSTTGALAGVVMSNETAYPAAIDVVGYNYTEGRYQTDHDRYPDRIIYGSENRHDLAAWKAVADNDHIFGQFLWTGIDYLGESGAWPARGSGAGLLDLAGFRKPIGWYRAALWSDKPVCYIGTTPLRQPRRSQRQTNSRPTGVSPYAAADTWNYENGQLVRVACFTNAPTARLTLNGQPVGGDALCDSATGILYWDISYAPGILHCEADNGASFELHTCAAPCALRLTTDSVAHAVIEIIDKDGNRVRQAENTVSIELHGATLLGMENGNLQDTSVAGRQRKNSLRTAGGRLMVYFRRNGTAPMFLKASSPLLEPAIMSIGDSESKRVTR